VIDRLRALLKRRRLDFQPLAVDNLLHDVSALMRPDAAARHVALECKAGTDLPLVTGDKVHLSQVLINLIINGMDAIAEACHGRRRVLVEVQPGADSSVVVLVADSGPGIRGDAVHRLFEAFYTTKAGGMGMGLAVSRTIIEAHGGRLWAENGHHGGAIFRFSLPVLAGGVA